MTLTEKMSLLAQLCEIIVTDYPWDTPTQIYIDFCDCENDVQHYPAQVEIGYMKNAVNKSTPNHEYTKEKVRLVKLKIWDPHGDHMIDEMKADECLSVDDAIEKAIEKARAGAMSIAERNIRRGYDIANSVSRLVEKQDRPCAHSSMGFKGYVFNIGD